MKRTSLLLLLACALLPATTPAQVQTGRPAFGTFGGGPDVINLANLNSNITIPIVSRPGRGMNFSYNLTFDSSVWTPTTSGSTASWSPASGWGWTQMGPVGKLSTRETVVETECMSGQRIGKISTSEFSWSYQDINGVHPFPSWSGFSSNGCTGQHTTFDLTNDETSDGSGYFLSASSSTFESLFDSYGRSLNPSTGSGSVQDRNGNEISGNSSGVFIDTLGTTVLTVSGTIPGPITYAYTAPSGASASYTEQYSAYTVKTNFGCSGVSEFGPTSENLVSEIDLPDVGTVPSDKYVITYEQTPGFPGDVTGRIASITFPTGGTITYSYSGGSNGITCADGSVATLTRQTPDGTWQYAHTESGTAWTTTVTDPQANQTVYDFQGLSGTNSIYQTERKAYQGTTTLLEDDTTCYNGNTTSCNTTIVISPITETIVTKTLGSQVCKHVSVYNSVGLLTEQDDYDYGSGAPGSLLRKQLISYASLGNNILGSPSQITVENGTGTIVAQTNITYDGSAVIATNSTPQHVSITGSRGNPTSVSSLVAGTGNLTKSFTYFDTGNVDVATDVNGGTTAYNYPDATSTCGNAFPTLVTEAVAGLSQSMTWNCTGGVQTSLVDENGNTTSVAYTDSHFWRPASSTDQGSNVTNYTYESQNSVESSLLFNSNASTTDILTTLDSLGRTNIAQKKQSPSASTYDSVETSYDKLGRPSQATVPYSGTAGQTTTSAPATSQTYDALNRPLVTTDGGGGTVTLSYTGNDTLQTVGPAPTGENTKRKQSEYNSIGQLTSVCEITAGTTSAPAGTCGQTTSATGYWTKYTYDVLGDLLTVTQNAQSSTTQSRSYTYDELGRMLSETNPETGTISYVYDTDATCGTSKGDLVKRTDAAGNVTCYAYDALHRPINITYASGPNSANTPSKFFVYDSATVNSIAMANAKTHVAEAYTCVSPCSSKITDEGFSYTVRGEVSDVYESTPHSSGYFHVNETYWANGALHVISGLTGLPTLTYAPDGEGRTSTVSAATGQNPVTSTTYNAASEATALTFGSADSDAFTFDPNTFRMTQYKYTVGATPQSVVGNLTWNANGSLGSLAITDPFNAADTQTCGYTHDDLSRIAGANCGTIFSDTFSYDAFGNITKTGTSQFQPIYSAATNHMTSIGSFTPTYDANGNVLNDNSHSYAWDSEGRPVTVSTMTATYDALNRIVEQSSGGTITETVYDPVGNRFATMKNSSTLSTAYVALPAGAQAVYTSQPGTLAFYRHPDWLGSARFLSTTNRAMEGDVGLGPFGEVYAATGASSYTFTGQGTENSYTNLYRFMYREYGTQGRWPSPDPAGLKAADPRNPQSWNRYAYVMNNPLRAVDPTGLWCVWQDGTHDPDPEKGGATEDQCNQQGGMWDPGDQTTGCDEGWNCTTGGGATVSGLCSSDDFSCTLTPQQDQQIQQIEQLWQQMQQMQQMQQQIQQLQQQQQKGWCTALANGGKTVIVISGGVALWGLVAEGTGIGAPVGLASQGSAAIGAILGGIADGLGSLGKEAGVCH